MAIPTAFKFKDIMPNENFEDDFEQVISSAGYPVGREELEAREALGDEQYEKIMAMTERSNVLALLKQETEIKYFQVLTAFYSSLILVSVTSIILGTVWSFYYWFS
jgi:hypothetical protein